jgi:serine O-acetyltransferase
MLFVALISMETRQRPDNREALKMVIDPEVGVKVVDLGLIREITVSPQGVEFRMVPASPACPLAGYLVEPVQRQVRSVANRNLAEGLLEDKVWSWDDTAPHLLRAGRI